MNCHECQEWLQRRLDGEPMPESVERRRHLAGCPVCRRQHQAAVRLLEGLHGVSAPLPAKDLPARIVALVLADRLARRRRLRFRLALGAVAASLMFAIAARYLWFADRSPQTDIARVHVPVAPGVPATLTKGIEHARTAVVTLSERLADEGKQQARLWLPDLDISKTLIETRPLDRPLDPAAQSLRQTGQGISESLQTVAQSARRAVWYFVRELPPLESAVKSGS